MIKLEIDGKQIEISEETEKGFREQLGIEKKTGFENCQYKDRYYAIDSSDIVDCHCATENAYKKSWSRANCFKDRELARKIDKWQTLQRKLYRFSMENDGDKIDYYTISPRSSKHSLIFSGGEGFGGDGYWRIEQGGNIFRFSTIYFYSDKIARQALDKFRNELEEVKDLFING